MRLQLRGVSPQLATPIMIKDVDLSTPKSRAILAVIFLPYVLMITAFTGATQAHDDPSPRAGALGGTEDTAFPGGAGKPVLLQPAREPAAAGRCP